MYLALMLKLCRAGKPDTKGPGQETSWLDGFSQRPVHKTILRPRVGRLGCGANRGAPVCLLGDAFVKEATRYQEAGGEEAREMLMATQNFPRAFHFSFATGLSP